MTIHPILLALALLVANATEPVADPPVPPVRARILAPLGSYFTSNDYPMEAEQFHVTGYVVFRVTIGADGRVQDCRILQQLQIVVFGERTCQILRERARYEPARDAQGNAATDFSVGRIRWTFEGNNHNRRRPQRAAAQRLAEQNAQCSDQIHRYTADLRISGCTALLASNRLNPQNRADAFDLRANAYLDQRDHARAIADLDEEIRIDPTRAMAFVNRCAAHEEAGDHARAIADCNEAVRIDPRSWGAFYNRGNVYRHMGVNVNALADYREAMRLEPDDAGIRTWLCQALQTAGPISDATIAACAR